MVLEENSGSVLEKGVEDSKVLFCPKCGVQREYDAKFCQNCGVSFKKSDETNKDIKTIFKCPYCAEEINPGAVKCKHCGEWLNKKAKAEEKDYSAILILGYIFSILGGVIGLIFALYLIFSGDKGARDHGIVMIIISVFVTFFALLFIISASSTPTYPTYSTY